LVRWNGTDFTKKSVLLALPSTSLTPFFCGENRMPTEILKAFDEAVLI
jgi:hypothetical protein